MHRGSIAVQIIMLSHIDFSNVLKLCVGERYVLIQINTREISGMSTPESVATTWVSAQPSPLVIPVSRGSLVVVQVRI